MYPSRKTYLKPDSVKKCIGGQHEIFSDDDYLICDHTVPGFSLARKRWCYFEVEFLHEASFDEGAFEALLLPAEQKDMIQSLVKVHGDEQLRFDDIISGKGKGMIFLLHGMPGVGKTLTAGMHSPLMLVFVSVAIVTIPPESVADYTKRPLYTISAGELGTTAAYVEEQLSSILRLAAIWNAIVLIDEADVFLEQRSPHDLKRNAMVAGAHEYFNVHTRKS